MIIQIPVRPWKDCWHGAVTASLPGFKTSVTSGVQVSLAPVRVNVTLEVGPLESRVEVLAPADNARFSVEGRAGEFITGRDGRYYIEDLPPGRYDARLHANGRDCRFTLRVPVRSLGLEQGSTSAELPTLPPDEE